LTFPIDITYLDGATDKKSPSVPTTWEAVCERFRACHEPVTTFDKLRRPAFSAGVRPPETDHKKAAIQKVTLAVWDLDAEPPETLHAVLGWLRQKGATYMVHTTASHLTQKKGGLGCWRVVAPLAEPVPAKDWRQTWEALNRATGGLNDAACKNADRIYFLPGWDAHNGVEAKEHTFHVVAGSPLDLGELWRHAKPADVFSVPSIKTNGLQLKDVATKLSRKRGNLVANDIGRRLADALDGREYAEPGERDLWRLKLATAIVDELPQADPESVAAQFDAAHRAMDPDPDEIERRRDSLAEKLTRLQLQKYGIPEEYADLASLAKKPEVLEGDSDSELAGWVLERWGGNPHNVYARGTLWTYGPESGTWAQRPDSDVWRTLGELDGGIVGLGRKRHVFRRSAHQTTSVTKGIKWDVDTPEFFDRSTPGIAFSNGFVNLKSADASLELAAHSPDNRATFAVPCDWDPHATCPSWLEVLNNVFEPDDDKDQKIDALQEFLGAALGGIATKYKRALVLSGTGANGKSTVLDIIGLLFPPSATVSQSPHSWTGSAGPYSLAQLAGAAVNLCAEAPEDKLGQAEKVKAVISGDPTQARPIREMPFEFRPRAAHVWAVNHPWATGDTSKGYWRRWLVLGFNRDFSADPTHRQDHDFVGAAKAELPGIYAWAFEGLRRLLAKGDYTVPESSVAAVEDWRTEADPIADWLSEEWSVVDETQDTVLSQWPTSRDLKESLLGWCSEQGVPCPPIGNKALVRKIQGTPHGAKIRAKKTGGHVRYNLKRNSII
jgi:P4 family phage/plasmid primase-like protien